MAAAVTGDEKKNLSRRRARAFVCAFVSRAYTIIILSYYYYLYCLLQKKKKTIVKYAFGDKYLIIARSNDKTLKYERQNAWRRIARTYLNNIKSIFTMIEKRLRYGFGETKTRILLGVRTWRVFGILLWTSSSQFLTVTVFTKDYRVGGSKNLNLSPSPPTRFAVGKFISGDGHCAR